MKNSFVFKLTEDDPFIIEGSTVVNINDSSEFKYTFWNPKTEIGRKQIYTTPRLFRNEAIDLFYISLMVYCVDKRVKRQDQDDAWTRNLELFIPVNNVEKWNACKETLIRALDFLTGDHWNLHFRDRLSVTHEEYNYRKNRWRFRNSIKKINTNYFCMLSGGLDSFIGAINLLKDGNGPVFVSHYGGGKGVKNFQDRIVNALISKYKVDPQLFFRFYAAPSNGKENSTRSRSLMFFAHAIVLASGMGHHIDLYIPENGVISLNIPLTIMRLGSLSTRTTHPYFMQQLQELLNALELDISLKNPFQQMTKGEMMKTCKDIEFLNCHYQYTLSCSHPDQGRWTGEDVGHCGECLPCTIRRAAIKSAGLVDSTIYRHNYDTPIGKVMLNSYKLGLITPRDSYSAIQMSGPITEKNKEFASLYERGIDEIKNLIDNL